MNELNQSKILRVRQGVPLCLDHAAAECGLELPVLLTDLRAVQREQYVNYGTKPFQLEIHPELGYVLIAGPEIGLLGGRLLTLEIQPKVAGLSVGKCLGLAQICASMRLGFDNSKSVQGLLSNSIEYCAYDYLGFSFLDALITVERNGFARVFEDVFTRSTKVQGVVDFQRTVTGGIVREPIVGYPDTSLNILPNRIIQTALTRCLDQVRALRLKDAFRHFNDALSTVPPIEDLSSLRGFFLHEFNLPRPDYWRALALALSIIKGDSVGAGGNDALPSVSINLDSLFEDYCSQRITEFLSPSKFEVIRQSRIAHDTLPSIGGAIVPDLIVRHKSLKTTIVVDVKNKYSALENGQKRIANSDLFQISYYARTLGIDRCLLLYPGAKVPLQFPFKGSQSKDVHKKQVTRFVDKIMELDTYKVFSKRRDPIILNSYSIDLGGDMSNTEKSVASFCLFIEYLLENEEA